jgi:hypothetical protein
LAGFRSRFIGVSEVPLLLGRVLSDVNHLANFADRVLLLPVELDGQPPLLFIQLLSPASLPAPRPGRLQPGLRPLADQVPLEFRQRTEDVKHQLTARRRRVDGLGDAVETDALPFQLGQQLDQVPQRPTQPVEPPHHQHVALPQQLPHPLQAGALHLAAAGGVLDDLAAARRLEGVALQVEILLIGRDAGVTALLYVVVSRICTFIFLILDSFPVALLACRKSC